MERPALQRLLADIAAGRIDVVVVYKVDRLTRSLADFAKHRRDASIGHGVSFVSVTQQFNTTTSMGRLTLNVLLSFAQFEREVTGERIRDKIAASKTQGHVDGRLACRSATTSGPASWWSTRPRPERVRVIYRAYLDLGAVRRVQQHLAETGVTGRGGRPLARGALFHLLQNRVYRGEVAHRGNVDLSRFSGEALGQVMAIFSNCAGLVKSSAEWRLTGL